MRRGLRKAPVSPVRPCVAFWGPLPIPIGAAAKGPQGGGLSPFFKSRRGGKPGFPGRKACGEGKQDKTLASQTAQGNWTSARSAGS